MGSNKERTYILMNIQRTYDKCRDAQSVQQASYEASTPGPLITLVARQVDNVGGVDWALVDQNNKVIAECFEIVGEDDKRPACANAELFRLAFNGFGQKLAVVEVLLETVRQILEGVSDKDREVALLTAQIDVGCAATLLNVEVVE